MLQHGSGMGEMFFEFFAFFHPKCKFAHLNN